MSNNPKARRIKMTNLLKVLKWRLGGHYDPEEGVQEDSPERARNRAKYEAWKYNTFGPGRDVFCRDRDLVYQIINSGQLQGEPLHINDPQEIASLTCIIAEMEGHKFIAMMTPVGTFKTKEDVEREEDMAIDRVVAYLIPNVPQYLEGYQRHFKNMLERLKEYNNPKS